MKNIHVLPTDKLSRLIKSQDNDFVYLNTNAPNWFENNLKTTKQNIYITNSEEIKIGDWFITDKNTICKCIKVDLKYAYSIEAGSRSKNNCKKIILTTDKDLINDGVQTIDDEFLEWFVKNPSCERVEISLEETQYGSGIYEYVIYSKEFLSEEPKQKTLTNDTDSHSWGFENFEVIKTEEDVKIFVETMENIPEPNGKLKRAFKNFSKQETLEEVAETELYRIINKIIDGGRDLPKGVNVSRGHAVDYAFEIALKVCKWQQEQNKNLYSEEDLEKAYKDGGRNEYDFINKYHCKARISFDKWFEQFKKK